MNRLPSRSTAAALLMAPLGTRLFAEMSLYAVESACACWMCPLVGLILSAPVFLCLRAMSNRAKAADSVLPDDGISRVLTVPPILLLLADCASMSALIASSANVTALNGTSIPVLLLPVFVVIWFMLTLGANTCGRSARVWLYFFAPLMLIVVAAQLRRYEPAWLTPRFGNGAADILNGGARCAGLISLYSFAWGVSSSDRNARHPLIYSMIGAGGASAALILFQMLFPVRAELTLTRGARLKMILSNGRIALGLQIVMIIIWYASLQHVICAESVTASCLLERLFPRVKSIWFAAGIALTICLPAALGFEDSALFAAMKRLLFPMCGGMLLLIALRFYIRLRRQDK